jgi:hypothetical protein
VNTALSALIIAILSLAWNIVAALHSWRSSTPKIKLRLAQIFYRQGSGLNVNVMNKGGSPIAVIDIKVWDQWSTTMGALKGDAYTSGRTLKTFSKKYGIGDPHGRDVDGPDLPFTIDGYHSQEWEFGNSWIKGIDAYRGKFLIEVALSTGKVVGKKVAVDTRHEKL